MGISTAAGGVSGALSFERGVPMVRSQVRPVGRFVSALLGLILLPGSLRAQQTPETHRVVTGETLWGLAQHYYTDPYKWPRIYEANREGIKDPHWIYPGQDLVIPDVAATQVVQQVT